MKASFLVTLLACHSAVFSQAIDLSGEWEFALDPQDSGIHATPAGWRFPDKIQLPGMLTAQGFGEKPSMKTKWTGDGWRYPELFKEWQADDNFKFPFFLQPPLHYLGPAWFRKEIEIPPDWSGKHARLHLERVHWQSIVWVDGVEKGRCSSLGTPHAFDLGALAPGRHVLTLRVDNRLAPVNVGPLSHSVTDHTQGNWNGVVGRIELLKVPPNRITDLQVYPSQDGSVSISVGGKLDAPAAKARVRIEVSPVGGTGEILVLEAEAVSRKPDGTFRIECSGNVGKPKPWNEFTPSLYAARANLECSADASVDTQSVKFGFREPGRLNGRLTINGTPIYLRGTLECCIFPLTGHPPTDVESWRRIVRICKAHGLNHIRFHSWCPPEAAFEAADELGFYYQVEASAWANQGAQIGSDRPLDAWLEDESKRILASYGNHPSFLMMAYGNEPDGKNHKAWLQQWVARRKQEDPRRFYTTGAGWPVMPGSDFHSTANPRIQRWGEGNRSIINGQPPRTDFNWSDHVKKHADAPVVAHEIGQWCVYPDFDEIPKYSGYFKPHNFEIFQETARRNGLLPQAKDFLMASGKLQTLAYKHDIEAALRTPGFGGFQLLDLHDFPGQGTALVGVLNAFWDSKGYVTPSEYARFSGPVVPLAEMKKMVWEARETWEAKLLLSHFGPAPLNGLTPTWTLSDGETVIAEGLLPARDLAAGALYELGSIQVPLDQVKAPARLTLTVGARGEAFSNDWNLFVYPSKTEVIQPENVTVTHSLDEALAALDQGGRVLWTPPAAAIADDSERPLIAGFSSIFWNTAWTNWNPPHTLGILCHPHHPALADFPTEFHSDWQWWELQQDARPFILTKHHALRPVVQVIDDWMTNRKLGYVFEAKLGRGSLLACAFDLESDPENRPVARQMRASLLAYMTGDGFAPSLVMTTADLRALVESEESGGARPLVE